MCLAFTSGGETKTGVDDADNQTENSFSIINIQYHSLQFVGNTVSGTDVGPIWKQGACAFGKDWSYSCHVATLQSPFVNREDFGMLFSFGWDAMQTEPQELQT